eukprot:TRINITY_DN586_c0_g1_i1.p1 TRINITY_DN586_c0_g1~~TRINITY_DN586_c0_g1_i1.p1  ORF type:complete len:173 (-),score=14.38 TRINITY_DN586_c0_g1_i1:75-593(-)
MYNFGSLSPFGNAGYMPFVAGGGYQAANQYSNPYQNKFPSGYGGYAGYRNTGSYGGVYGQQHQPVQQNVAPPSPYFGGYNGYNNFQQFNSNPFGWQSNPYFGGYQGYQSQQPQPQQQQRAPPPRGLPGPAAHPHHPHLPADYFGTPSGRPSALSRTAKTGEKPQDWEHLKRR